MRKGLLLVAAVVFFLSVFTGCKPKSHDPVWVTNHYLSSLEKKDYDAAYRHLYPLDSVLTVTSPQGKKLHFMPRPDLETFKRSYSRVEEMKVLSIESREKLEGKLEMFDVQTRLVEGGEAKVWHIGLYLAPDADGRWWVVIPPPPFLEASPVADTSS